MRWSRALLLSRIALLAFVTLLGLGLPAAVQSLPTAPPDPSAPVLFSAWPGVEPRAVDNDPEVLRSRSLAANLDLLSPQLSAAPRRVTLELFPDAVYTASLDRLETHEDGAYTWIGTVEGAPFGEVQITILGDDLTGNVFTLDRQFGLASAGSGRYIVRQVDATALPPEAEPLIPENLPAEDAVALDSTTASDPCTDIDLMIVYTQEAENWAASHGGINAFIDDRVANINAGYQNSQVDQRVHLVYKNKVSYTQPADPWSVSNWSQVLYNLTSPSDGAMDTVHTWRDTYKADETLLFIRAAGSPACGIGWLMDSLDPSFQSSAFAVVDVDCADYQYSDAHELGHNMGSHHEHASAGSEPTIYPYSYGYVHTSNGADNNDFRTMMAYSNSCTRMPNGYYCPRINYWSNPDMTYPPTGDALGVSGTGSTAADNHRSLNNTNCTVANFRQSNLLLTRQRYLPAIFKAVPAPVGRNPGYWQSSDGSSEFTVSANGASVSDYAVYIKITNCGSFRIRRTVSDPIVNNQMSFTGSFYATVNFSSATTAGGSDGLNRYYIAACNGYMTGGPWTNSFTWKHTALDPGVVEVPLIPRQDGDPAPQDVAGVTIERIR